MIMACGTGKTLVSLHIAEKIAGKGGFVLFLVPSISLIVQCMREWSDNANMKHYYVAVCSDKSTGEEIVCYSTASVSKVPSFLY